MSSDKPLSAKNSPSQGPWTDFEDGLYAALAEKIPPPGGTEEETAALIASLAFLGRMDEATGLWRLRKDALSAKFQRRVRFALVISATRISRFKAAKTWLLEFKKENALEDPFVRQSFAFYFYFVGDFKRSSLWAKRALDAALSENNPYIRLLASDLLGHSLVQRGRLSVGFRWLEQARKVSQERGNLALDEMIRISKLLYEAEAGFRPLEMIGELERARDSRKAEDSYAHADLSLELSRQWILRGEWKKARTLLDLESTRIYSFENRHQEMRLLLRLAEVAYHQGRAADCGHFLRSARRALNRLADQIYEIRVLGLEIKVETDLLGGELPLDKKERLLQLNARRSDRLNRQMLSRRGWTDEVMTAPGEDPLHDLLKMALSHPDQALREMARKNYWGLWARTRNIPFGAKAIVIGAPEVALVLVDQNGVQPLQEGVGPLVLRLVTKLMKGFVDKQELIETVWGYEYDPLRHDSLVYGALSSLRRLLGERGDWLENSEEGWRMTPGLTWMDLSLRPQEETFVQEPDRIPLDLSYRQHKALKELERREVWVIREYRSFFHVSTMTAFRDLDDLAKKGYILRQGKGRATCYVRPGRNA